jgi:hypothetical protein
MTTAYVERTLKGEWLNINCFSAQTGFYHRGIFVEGFVASEIDDLPLTGSDTIVHGSVTSVRKALARLGCEPPAAKLPLELQHHLGRSSREGLLGDIREKVLSNYLDEAVFIKPAHAQKAFTGQVISGIMDLMSSNHLPDDLVITIQSAVDFLSEWRVFVLDGRVLNVSHYAGIPTLYPDLAPIQSFIDEYTEQPDSFCAYGADFGVLDQSRKTVLIELNDSFSLGSYGLNSPSYAAMIEARWNQLTGKLG